MAALALLLTAPVRAQALGASAQVTVRDGDLYLLDGGRATRLTTYGHNSAPVMSRERRYVAYFSEPPELVKADRIGSYAGGIGPPLAYTVWIMNLETREAWKAGTQPAGLRLEGYGQTAHALERSGLTVTDNHSAFAWIERPFGEWANCSVVYADPEKRTVRRVRVTASGVQCVTNGYGLNELTPLEGDHFLVTSVTAKGDVLLVGPRGFRLVPLP